MNTISEYIRHTALQTPQEFHRKAAENHERATKHHFEAARLHEKGDHRQASIHASIAQTHAVAGLESGSAAMTH